MMYNIEQREVFYFQWKLEKVPEGSQGKTGSDWCEEKQITRSSTNWFLVKSFVKNFYGVPS